MSKYAYYDPPRSDTAATTNMPMYASASTSTRPPMVLSDHCAAGNHDYGYSDRCECPCHKGRRPTW